MIILVTSNRHKFEEISGVFRAHGLELKWVNMTYEEIQADTTEEVSMDSCLKLSGKVEGDYFIEDSGLFIESLKGFPGIYSSYVQKTIGNTGVLKLLDGAMRDALFRTVISARLGGEFKQFTGILKGEIVREIRGTGGFGYDPIFLPAGENLTLAEMELERKNQISHRYRAVMKLLEFIKENS